MLLRSRLGRALAFGFVLAFVCTPTVVEVANVVTVEQRLLQPDVDLVVDVASPPRRRVARADLRRELLEQFAEMSTAFATAYLLVSWPLP